MSSRLLALPRELRDNIYTRLTHNLVFKDNYQLSYNKISVAIRGAPVAQLLLVNRQLHDEYKETIRCSAHIAVDTLETFRFNHLDTGLQRALASQVQSITLLIDWCNRSQEQEQRVNHKPKLFWRMFQNLAHEIVHPQVTTLKIAYIDSIGSAENPQSLETLERVILQTREDAGGTLFTTCPRELEGCRLVQSAEAFRIEHGYSMMPHPFDVPVIRPVRVAFLAYSAPGYMLEERSFWPFDEQGQLALPVIESLGRWENRKYTDSAQFGQDLRGLIDRKGADALTKSANCVFVCGSTDCNKCARAKEKEADKQGLKKGFFKQLRRFFSQRKRVW